MELNDKSVLVTGSDGFIGKQSAFRKNSIGLALDELAGEVHVADAREVHDRDACSLVGGPLQQSLGN